MKDLVFATNNPHKLDEIKKITKGVFRILSLHDIGCHEDIDETGTTLEENALIKARFVKERYNYDCFADDTGLEVAALNGAPGVYTARYAGSGCTPADNMEKVLAELRKCENRAARFRTVIALILQDQEYLFDGAIDGEIINEKRGAAGFGYDPVFVPRGYEKTFAELGDEVKNKISHRAVAIEKLKQFILSLQ